MIRADVMFLFLVFQYFKIYYTRYVTDLLYKVEKSLFLVCWIFLSWKVLDFVRFFSCIYWYNLFFSFINMVYYFNFHVLKPLQSCNQSHLVMVHNPFYMLLDLVAKLLLRGFVSIFIRYTDVFSWDVCGFIELVANYFLYFFVSVHEVLISIL